MPYQDRVRHSPYEQDHGCEVADRCVECPLVACREDYAREGVTGPEQGIIKAIALTLNAGICTPRISDVWWRLRCGIGSLNETGRRLIGVAKLPGEAHDDCAIRLLRAGVSIRDTAMVSGVYQGRVEALRKELFNDRS